MALAWTSEAYACKPFIQPPTVLTAPVVLDPAIEVESAELRIDCHQTRRRGLDLGELRCDLRSVQRLRNIDSTPVQTVGLVALGGPP